MENWTCTALQSEAWGAWNLSYYEGDPEPYRVVARALYARDVHERILARFAALDEQNARLNALLRESTA